MPEIKTYQEDHIFKIIDNILKQVFGEKSTNMIYEYLETHYSLHQKEFSQKIDVFAKGIESFLHSGAPLLEQKILKDVCASYGVLRNIEFSKKQEYDFANEMRFAMRI